MSLTTASLTTAAVSRRHLLLGAAGAATLPVAWAQQKPAPAWADIEKAARGQTVFFNAWAGSERTNAYLQWVAAEVMTSHGVKLEHVKITDTADVVKRVRAEKAAGRGETEGTVDLVWINGENFATLKREGLLFGPFAEAQPNFQYVDVAGKPTTRNDFSVPTEGMESPWGMAQLTLFADGKRLPKPPQNMAELLALARSQPGRITYPRLPDFTGTTFVKQALIEHVSDVSLLSKAPVAAAFAQQTANLWTFLDALHPHLWRGGKQFPQTPAAIRQMMADGELLLAWTFNPNEPANEIAAKRLSPSVVSWQFAKGTIGNTHFVAIPYNARGKAGAQVVANFLLSAKAQARKADIAEWGDPTVLDLKRLPAADRALFPAKPLPGQVAQAAPTLPEPHAGWVDPLEREWTRRYA
ncbi:ABC transporter substrate-binding protein [Hydrogenophaga sp. PAMC20947]|uniref:ABC transporter substrate-binding protein n=1 Tax=Hydrogenophaga sp. PAMC20947 TaxID=2565558 RepID=UPI001FF9E0DD|nr:ABC transporter substrate-binding protein [Hydrogenophaga sp. PAMC20947]